MATSIALNIITGRTGTAHVSSDDDAAIWRGLVGNDNITLYTDQQLALDYQTKGRLSLSDGVFCIAGKMGRVSNASYVEYGLPSPGSCRRTYLLVRYAIDNNGIESMSLLTLQSEDATGSDAATTAATLPITVDAETDYVLYDFVCDEDGVVSGTMKTKLTVMDTIPSLSASIDNRKIKVYTGEKTSVDAGDVYFSFDGNASTILNASRIAVIKLWKMNDTGKESAVCVWVKSSNHEIYWRTAPVLMTVNGNDMLVVFQIILPKSGAKAGTLACRCIMTQNGVSIISPQNIPFDRATIFAWLP